MKSKYDCAIMSEIVRQKGYCEGISCVDCELYTMLCNQFQLKGETDWKNAKLRLAKEFLREYKLERICGNQ